MRFSYSGSDVTAVISFPVVTRVGNSFSIAYTPGEVLGELMTVSFSSHREVIPVRALGFSYAKGHVRGPRTIGGSLVFAVFNSDVVTQFRAQMIEAQRAHYEYLGLQPPATIRDNILMDEMPPFDIHCFMAPENGGPENMARMTIRNCLVVNEGQVMSIEDMITERTMNYVAEGIVTNGMALRREGIINSDKYKGGRQ